MRTASAGNFPRLVAPEVGSSAFLGLVAGVAGSIFLGFVALPFGGSAPAAAVIEAAPMATQPVRQPARTAIADAPVPRDNAGRFATAYDKMLAAPMTFTPARRVLLAEGSIEAGSTARLAAALAAHPEVTRISLNSPGGALDDAMAMAKLVRDRGIATEVADGAICASSCPLFFAGGNIRTAGSRADVAVHQFYAAPETISAPAQAMSDAQMTAARVARHLGEMGIDPALWLHALDTPPQALYHFSPEEMVKYHLVTSPVATAHRTVPARRG